MPHERPFRFGTSVFVVDSATAWRESARRVGCTVFANDFRHPAMLAKELATLDLLSGGRLEVGIGAGWNKAEYVVAGIPFDSPRVRGERLQEADIIDLLDQAMPDGGLDTASDTEARLAEKVGWVRAAAGARIAQIELAMLIWGVVVSDDRQGAAEALAPERGLTPEQILASPYFLIGSIEGIIERLQALRERYGVSYISVVPEDNEAFAPVVARLAGR